jgi:hypothetical protein
MAGICAPAHLNATELRGSQGALKGLGKAGGFRYPLVMTNIANWKITMSNGKTHYFYGHFQ